MPQMVSTDPMVLIWEITGETTATCGSLRRTSAILAETGAPPTAVRKLELGGWTKRSAPMPVLLARLPLTWPMKTPVMERIMMTSMATASTLMATRIGRCTRLPSTSLFIGRV